MHPLDLARPPSVAARVYDASVDRDPYRSAEVEDPREAPRDPGIVGDIISQFADPNAFYRELVQNAIDAGTPSIDIRIEYDSDAQLMRVAVADRGEGMTRDVVENQLLVLFRSTKERDRTKIGKFGIGFASVLAPEPDIVIVTTAHGGRKLTLHLHRDLSYELFDAGPVTRDGTTVELELAMTADRVDGFVAASRASLERWCRHAAVPIDLAVHVPGQQALHARVDRPLGLDRALVEVRRTVDEGQLVAVVGLTDTAAPYTGFFNHGLMLHETAEPLLGGVAVKLQDSRLGHTLSRDDVRRDVHFERAVAVARELVRDSLPGAVATAVRGAAEADDLALHRRLCDAAIAATIAVPREALTFPLVEPLGEQRVVDATALTGRVWTSARRSPITALLAARGEAVIHGRDHAWLEAYLKCRLVDVERELTAVEPIEPSDADTALVALLRDLLAAVYRAPDAILLARLTGAHADGIAIGGAATGAHVVDRDTAGRTPFARLRSVPLVLSANHPHVAAARADVDAPVLAAAHLARAVLLHYRLLDVARSEAMLAATLARIGIGAAP
jgi:molecular chaperone HtpG